MDLMTARAIMARVFALRGVAERIGPLLTERAWKLRLGATADVGSIDRTIDDLAGHYHDGAFVGAAQIVAASALCIGWAST